MATGTFKKLQAAAKGLIYSSESDRAVKAVHLDALAGASTPLAAVAAAAGVDPSEITVVSVSQFLEPMVFLDKWATEEDKAVVAQFQVLQAALEGLEGAAAHRVGEGCDIAVWVMGKDPEGGFVGVKTRITET